MHSQIKKEKIIMNEEDFDDELSNKDDDPNLDDIFEGEIIDDEVNEDEDYLFALKIQKEYEDYLVALKTQKEDEDYLVALKIQKEDEDYLLALKTEKEEIKEEEKQKEQDIKYAQQLEAAEHERRQKKIEEIVSKNSFGREPEQLTKLRYSLDEFLDKTAANAIIEEVIVNRHAHPETPAISS
jgi:Fe2+ transport system protein B